MGRKHFPDVDGDCPRVVSLHQPTIDPKTPAQLVGFMDVPNNSVRPPLQLEAARLEINRILLEDLDYSGTIIHSGKRLSGRKLGRVVLRGHHGLCFSSLLGIMVMVVSFAHFSFRSVVLFPIYFVVATILTQLGLESSPSRAGEQTVVGSSKPTEQDRDFQNSIGMKFVLIPPGEFMMGSTPEEIEEALTGVLPGKQEWVKHLKSELPRHKVILTQAIYLGVNEVTQKDYKAVMGTNPSGFSSTGQHKDLVADIDTDNHPVETVTWYDAFDFCEKLSEKESLKPSFLRVGQTITSQDGTGYRLPTEAQWEFACRAGTTTNSRVGDKDDELVRTSWFVANSGGRTHAAGELQANPFGLSDIQGNVWEWVQDAWVPTYYDDFAKQPAIDPNGPSSAQRVFRGGAWNSDGVQRRSSWRYPYDPQNNYSSIGFRVVLAINSPHQPEPLSRLPQLNYVKSMAPKPDFSAQPAHDGDALMFDGVDDYVELPFGYEEGNTFTIEAWVNSENSNINSAQYVVSDIEVGGIGLVVHPGEYIGSVSLKNESDNSIGYVNANASFNNFEKATHLAFVVDTAEIRIFIDGKLADRKDRNARVMNASARNFVIGAQPDGQESEVRDFLCGQIDEVRVSAIARYTEDFTPQKRFETDQQTLALYHFDEGQGDVLTDSSSNGHHGKIHGARWANSNQPAFASSQSLSNTALVQSPHPLPDVLSWTLQTKHHVTPVRRIQHSPDGMLLATSSSDGTVRLWDARSKQLLRILSTGRAQGRTLEFSPGGEYLAAYDYSDNVGICIWEVATGRLVHRFLHGQNTFKKIAWNPQQPQLATSSDTEIVIWNLENGHKLKTYSRHADAIEYLHWSADGSRLTSISRSTVFFWDAIDGIGLGELKPGYEMTQMAVSPEGNLLVTGGDKDRLPLELWNLAKGTKVTLSPYSGGITAITFSQDGSEIAYVRGGESTMIRQLVTTGEILAELDVSNKIEWIDYAPDGETLVSAGDDVQTWDLKTGQSSLLFSATSVEIGQPLWTTPGTELGIAGRDDELWQLDLSQEPTIKKREYQGIGLFYVSQDKQYYCSRDHGANFHIHDAKTGQLIRTLTHKDDVVLSPDSRVLAYRNIGVSNRVHLVEFSSDKLLQTLELDAHSGCFMRFSPDGKKLALTHNETDGGRLEIWDVETGKQLHSIKDNWGWSMGHLDWAPDGQTIAVRRLWGSSIYDSNTGEALLYLNYAAGNPADTNGYIHFHPDGETLSIRSKENFLFYKLRDENSNLRGEESQHRDGRLFPYQHRKFNCWNSPAWSADDSIMAIPIGEKLVLFYDWSNDRVLGTLSIMAKGEKYAALFVDSSGHYEIVGEMSEELVYTVLKIDGTQQTLTSSEFEAQYQWKNAPAKFRLIRQLIESAQKLEPLEKQ